VIYLYPTDTVFGLGVDARDARALEALTALKGREEGKYYPVIVKDLGMAKQYAVFTPLAERLAARYWPGKLTLVLEAQNLPRELLAPDGTVGIRVPGCDVLFDYPVTATSANVSGFKPQSTVPAILAQFGDKRDLIYQVSGCPQELPPSLPSTVVDARGDTPVLIREGAVLWTELQNS
jgi:L-threonylcarbamoyladenylate synthase